MGSGGDRVGDVQVNSSRAPDQQTPLPSGQPPFTELTARRLGPVRRFFVRRPVAMDLVVMAWFGLPAVATRLSSPAVMAAANDTPVDGSVTGPIVVATVLMVIGTGVLFWRRRRPVLVAALMTVLAVACTAVAGSISGFELAIALALYAVAASRSALTTWLSFTGVVAATCGAVWLWETTLEGSAASATAGPGPVGSGRADPSLDQVRLMTIAFVVIFALLAVAIGTSVRNRRLHVADLVDRTNAFARDRDQQARLARATERSRIAREMHDVVAHSLSVMIALADGAGAALDRAPDRSRRALDELSMTGRTALGDMRRVLGVLNEPEAPFEPQPGSTDLAGLVERFRTVGVPVRATGLGSELPADAGLQLAVYRIVQESLTNILRHAPGTAQVDVALRTPPGRFEIEVVDDGPAMTVPPGDGAGHGVIGMRERAGVFGGTVEAGPWHGGWRVHAVLPWHDPDQEDA